MTHPRHIQTAAATFWQRAGINAPFPRQMEEAIMLALPVTIIAIPRLQLQRIEYWLQHRNVAYQFPCQDRRVRGCLVAYKGQGAIFFDADDPPDEVRLTLAHEAAHFLEDYLAPRLDAITRLGPEIMPILDGEREPTIKERVHAVLARTPIAVYYRYIDRGAKGEITLSAVWNAEDRADQLALELVAPADEVRKRVRVDQPIYQQRRLEMVQVLTSHFGLSADMADSYGGALLHSIGRGPTFLEHLGFKSS